MIGPISTAFILTLILVLVVQSVAQAFELLRKYPPRSKPRAKAPVIMPSATPPPFDIEPAQPSKPRLVVSNAIDKQYILYKLKQKGISQKTCNKIVNQVLTAHPNEDSNQILINHCIDRLKT